MSEEKHMNIVFGNVLILLVLTLERHCLTSLYKMFCVLIGNLADSLKSIRATNASFIVLGQLSVSNSRFSALSKFLSVKLNLWKKIWKKESFSDISSKGTESIWRK